MDIENVLQGPLHEQAAAGNFTPQVPEPQQGLQGIQNKEKIDRISELVEEIAAANQSYADPGKGTYYDYDLVIEGLLNVRTVLTESARTPRPKDLPEDMPWSEKLVDPEEDFDPYAYDGSMSEKDYDRMVSEYQKDRTAENVPESKPGTPDIAEYLAFMEQQNSLSRKPAYDNKTKMVFTLPELTSVVNHLDRVRVGLLVDCREHMGSGDRQFTRNMDEIGHLRALQEKLKGTLIFHKTRGMNPIVVALSGRDAQAIRYALNGDHTEFAKALSKKVEQGMPKELLQANRTRSHQAQPIGM